jgi:rubrerythrin
MDFKLFASTFALIFLAELGDKTQLAAMARTAGAEGAKWVVFAAASSALVFSTLIAVLFGSLLTKVVPQHYIRMAAGILFVVFGLLILRSALARAPAGAAAAPHAPAGVFARAVVRAAAGFERASAADYRALAARPENAAHRTLFEALAQEEDAHLRRMEAFALSDESAAVAAGLQAGALERPDLEHNVAASAEPALLHAIEHEEALAAFYEGLAQTSPRPSLRDTFRLLAAEERGHAGRLRTAM